MEEDKQLGFCPDACDPATGQLRILDFVFGDLFPATLGCGFVFGGIPETAVAGDPPSGVASGDAAG
jgi:hypothetical protein